MEITRDTLFKFTGDDGVPTMGRQSFRWPLPTQNEDGTWTPGAWTRAYKSVIPCKRGYHLARLQDLIKWWGSHLWVAEHDDPEPIIHEDSKVVVRRARLLAPVLAWNERTQRLFAADCAERVLPIYERARPGDSRPRVAVETARLFARGVATRDELFTARDAAWSAAMAAARDAARDAAGDAARDAAWAAARDAEREWQTARLFQYLNGEIS